MLIDSLIIVFGLICGALTWVLLRKQETLPPRRPIDDVYELGEPFTVEVLLDDVPVARLSDRQFIEMFWRSYRIEPLSAEAAKIVHDDNLWDQCRFAFRDPDTKEVSRTGFAGGSAPFIRDGRITLRALYFKS